jgi:integrase/recombinase XerD
VEIRNSLRDLKIMYRKIGISGSRLAWHALRHTFAVNFIRDGGDVFSLQRILGHASLEMTKRYVNLQTEDLKLKHLKHATLLSQ